MGPANDGSGVVAVVDAGGRGRLVDVGPTRRTLDEETFGFPQGDEEAWGDPSGICVEPVREDPEKSNEQKDKDGLYAEQDLFSRARASRGKRAVDATLPTKGAVCDRGRGRVQATETQQAPPPTMSSLDVVALKRILRENEGSATLAEVLGAAGWVPEK